MQRLDSSAGGGGGAAADLLQPQQSEDDILMEAEAVLAASSATTAATTTAQQLNRAEQQRVDGRVELVVSIFRLARFMERLLHCVAVWLQISTKITSCGQRSGPR
jgi:hypothetical protein